MRVDSTRGGLDPSTRGRNIGRRGECGRIGQSDKFGRALVNAGSVDSSP